MAREQGAVSIANRTERLRARQRLFPPEHTEGVMGHLASLIPLGRVGRADEVAKAAVFLALRRQQFRQRDRAVCRRGHRSNLNQTGTTVTPESTWTVIVVSAVVGRVHDDNGTGNRDVRAIPRSIWSHYAPRQGNANTQEDQ